MRKIIITLLLINYLKTSPLVIKQNTEKEIQSKQTIEDPIEKNYTKTTILYISLGILLLLLIIPLKKLISNKNSSNSLQDDTTEDVQDNTTQEIQTDSNIIKDKDVTITDKKFKDFLEEQISQESIIQKETKSKISDYKKYLETNIDFESAFKDWIQNKIDNLKTAINNNDQEIKNKKAEFGRMHKKSYDTFNDDYTLIKTNHDLLLDFNKIKDKIEHKSKLETELKELKKIKVVDLDSVFLKSQTDITNINEEINTMKINFLQTHNKSYDEINNDYNENIISKFNEINTLINDKDKDEQNLQYFESNTGFDDITDDIKESIIESLLRTNIIQNITDDRKESIIESLLRKNIIQNFNIKSSMWNIKSEDVDTVLDMMKKNELTDIEKIKNIIKYFSLKLVSLKACCSNPKNIYNQTFFIMKILENAYDLVTHSGKNQFYFYKNDYKISLNILNSIKKDSSLKEMLTINIEKKEQYSLKFRIVLEDSNLIKKITKEWNQANEINWARFYIDEINIKKKNIDSNNIIEDFKSTFNWTLTNDNVNRTISQGSRSSKFDDSINNFFITILAGITKTIEQN